MTYETKGGVVSEDDAIMQLIEHLRESSEAAYRVSHINNQYKHTTRAEGFRQIGQRLEEMTKIALTFATRAGHA
jgi:hypothetical protein